MRAFWALVAVLVFDAARAINTAGEPCFKTSRDEDIVLKTCNGIEIQSAMCAKNVGEVDTLLDAFAPLVDTWLSTNTKSFPECRDFWKSRCEAIGGNVKETTECNEVCGALATASVRCTTDTDCDNELVWRIPSPIPSVRDSVSLSIGLACCSWVETTLNSVCENVNSTALTEYLSIHTTADVQGNCRETEGGVPCLVPAVTEAGGSKSSGAAALGPRSSALAPLAALLLAAAVYSRRLR